VGNAAKRNTAGKAPRAVGVVTSKDEQDAMTAAGVIDALLAGNARYVAGELTARDHIAQLAAAEAGQYPSAIVLSCVDSRVPVEAIFDCGIGDIFVARVAGNQINADILGSMEYACHVAGSKAVVVMGHQHCGAVKSAIDGVQLGNITELLDKIAPAVAATSGHDDRSSANGDFVAEVTATNVRHAVAAIRERSQILAEAEAAGTIAVVGALYNLATGLVSLVDDVT